jgi:hypothetical protein
MNKTRILGLVVGATLIVAVILIALGFTAAPKAEGRNPTFTGFGDLRRYEQQLDQSASIAQISSRAIEVGENIRRSEARKSIVASGVTANNVSGTGMGDLRRFEAQVTSAKNSVSLNSSSGIGMGDLHRYEAQELISSADAKAINAGFTGFGDLRRYEAQLDSAKGLATGTNIGMGDLQRFEAQQWTQP